MLIKEDIRSILKEYKSSIDNELVSLLDNIDIQDLARSSTLDSIRYSVHNGGKRLRAVLSLLTAEAVLNSEFKFNENPAAGLALAIELVHCGSLIHDDLPCMDDDDLRRGKPSNHIEFGEATALLAGDTLLCYPLEVLITKTPETRLTKEVELGLLKAIRDMIAGQAMDLELAQDGVRNVNDLKKMQELKTGALLTASIKLAAMLAGANKIQVEALELFAGKLGLAFQIVDDILDATADTQQLGKTAGKDIEQNKFTYVQEYGLDGAKDMAHDLIKQAKLDIDDIGVYTDKLKMVADYVVSRNN